MARLASTQGSGAVSERIRARRGGVLRPLDGFLLHSPEIADGWNSLLGAIRSDVSLSPDIRELIVMRVAVLNRADYEWETHRPFAIAAGLGELQLAALAHVDAATDDALSDIQQRVVAYTDAMTNDVQVTDAVFDAVRADFNVAELVEITATVAAYNMVSRFLVALQVDLPVAAEVGP